ncbi:MAG: 50S ribosome-binding GTPase [Longilinea sp.]|nr:50S ribosome-binding GTPase [Longilinea sp.]MCA1954210.1 50S ribosome-binding GTPase [Anaerolinea sp.]
MKSDELLHKMPEETRQTVEFIWSSLPGSERTILEKVIQGIPSDANLLRMLFKMATTQLRLSFGQKRSVAIVGPANVGKSTLYNQLVQTREDRALVSALPGTTRINQQADAGLFAIVDTPGADAVGAVGEEERQRAFAAARQADVLIIVFDAIQGIKRTEQELYQDLVALGKPYVVVLNKTDLVRREVSEVVRLAATNLQLEPEQVIPIVAKDGRNLAQVVVAISLTEPGIVAALGQALPHYRWRLAWRSIVSAASVSAVIALAPMPIIDFVPLIATQTSMVLGIARIYNYPIDMQRARELLVTFGVGFLGRTLFQELSKLGGVPGWVLSAAIAASTTVAMGYAAAIWFEKGEKVSRASLNAISSNLTKLLLERLRGKNKRPGEIKEQVAAALQDSPLAEDRAPLDEQAEQAEQTDL